MSYIERLFFPPQYGTVRLCAVVVWIHDRSLFIIRAYAVMFTGAGIKKDGQRV